MKTLYITCGVALMVFLGLFFTGSLPFQLYYWQGDNYPVRECSGTWSHCVPDCTYGGDMTSAYRKYYNPTPGSDVVPMHADSCTLTVTGDLRASGDPLPGGIWVSEGTAHWDAGWMYCMAQTSPIYANVPQSGCSSVVAWNGITTGTPSCEDIGYHTDRQAGMDCQIYEPPQYASMICYDCSEPAEPFCGDGACNGDEDQITCPDDCGPYEPPPGNGGTGNDQTYLIGIIIVVAILAAFVGAAVWFFA